MASARPAPPPSRAAAGRVALASTAGAAARLAARAVLLAVLWAVPAASGAAGDGPGTPRFATVNTDRANVRTGPGLRYPVEWVFVRRHMPVEVVAEFDTWRRVRDWEGAEGWMHQSLLSGRRGVIIRGREPWPLRADASPTAPVRARIEPGVIGRLLECPARSPGTPGLADPGGWCRVEIAALRGWLPRQALWGVYDDEQVD